MRNAIRMLAAIVVALSCVVPLHVSSQPRDAASAEQLRREIDQLPQAIKQYSAERKDEAAAKAREVLNSLDQRVDSMEKYLDENWDKLDKAGRAKAREALRALRRERVEIAEWYGSLKSSAPEIWEHAKAGFANASDALRKAWDRAETDVRRARTDGSSG